MVMMVSIWPLLKEFLNFNSSIKYTAALFQGSFFIEKFSVRYILFLYIEKRFVTYVSLIPTYNIVSCLRSCRKFEINL